MLDTPLARTRRRPQSAAIHARPVYRGLPCESSPPGEMRLAAAVLAAALDLA
jgi:hypothetical protein